MPLNPFRRNPFGSNATGMNPMGIAADEPPTGSGLFGSILAPPGTPQGDALMTAAAALMQGSGWSPVRQSTASILGSALLAGQQARAVAQDRIQKQKLQDAQIAALQNPQTDDIKEFQYAQANGFKGSFEEWQAQKRSSGAEPPASIQEWNAVNEGRKQKGLPAITLDEWLKTRASFTPINPTVQMIGNVPNLVQPTRADPANPVVTPLSTLQQEATGASTVKGAETTGAASAERNQKQIDTGLDAADATANVRRSLDLLNSVSTGGIDAAKLKITNTFGVTGADEAELSANLGKAVLSKLRATFGAQFTEGEGRRLAEIESGFGKSTEGNKRLLEQTQKILERVARRGIRAAARAGDADTAQEIKDALEFSIAPDSTGAAVPDDIGSLLKKYGGKK